MEIRNELSNREGEIELKVDRVLEAFSRLQTENQMLVAKPALALGEMTMLGLEKLLAQLQEEGVNMTMKDLHSLSKALADRIKREYQGEF